MATTPTGKQKLREDEALKIYFEESRNFLVVTGTGKVTLWQEEANEKGREKGKQYELVPGNTI